MALRVLPRLKTIKVSGGKYVQVKDRIIWFLTNCPDGRIDTEVIRFEDGIQFIVRAKVTYDINHPEDYSVGHSYGDFTKQKGLEKAESSAVGRALGLGGIGIVNADEIASADEMKDIGGKEEYSQKKGGLFPTQKVQLRDVLVGKGIEEADLQKAIYDAMIENAGGDENMNYGRGQQLIKDIEKCEYDTLMEIAKGNEPFKEDK